MEKIDYNTGPYGQYTRKSLGHILNALCHWGIPLNVVESLHSTPDGEIRDNKNQVFARYKYFDGIEQPLFYFTAIHNYNDHLYTVEQIDGHDEIQPNFRLQLSSKDTPGLMVDQKILATPVLHAIFNRTLTNYMNDPWYEVHKKAGAFFQGGYGSPEGEYFYIEFWQSKGAQAYIDRLNSEYINMTKFYERM